MNLLKPITNIVRWGKAILLLYPFKDYSFTDNLHNDRKFVNKLTLFLGITGILGFIQHVFLYQKTGTYAIDFSSVQLAFGIALLSSYFNKNSFHDKIQILYTYSLFLILVGICHLYKGDYIKSIANLVIGGLLLFKLSHYFYQIK